VRRYLSIGRANLDEQIWNWDETARPELRDRRTEMTDYRLRNHDLLYTERDPAILTWRNVVVFGAIAVTVTIGVVGHLNDRFSITAAGFAPASAGAAAQHAAARQPAVHLATPASFRSGS
jgi:hypothetical protein